MLYIDLPSFIFDAETDFRCKYEKYRLDADETATRDSSNSFSKTGSSLQKYTKGSYAESTKCMDVVRARYHVVFVLPSAIVSSLLRDLSEQNFLKVSLFWSHYEIFYRNV